MKIICDFLRGWTRLLISIYRLSCGVQKHSQQNIDFTLYPAIVVRVVKRSRFRWRDSCETRGRGIGGGVYILV